MNFPGTLLLRNMAQPPQRKATIVLATSTILLTAWWYLAFGAKGLSPQTGEIDLNSFAQAVWPVLGSGIVLLGLIPMLIIRVVLRESLTDFGWSLGNLRQGIGTTLLFAAVFAGCGYWAALQPEYQAVYPQNAAAGTQFALHLACLFLFYLAWEFHFRGFLFLGLEKPIGLPTAMMIQIMASTFGHLGKPPSEAFGAIGGGLLFAIFVVRTRSVLYGAILHFLLGAALDYFCLFPR